MQFRMAMAIFTFGPGKEIQKIERERRSDDLKLRKPNQFG